MPEDIKEEKKEPSVFKKILFWLQHIDGIWSVPLTFLAFYLMGVFIQWIGGYGTGSYDLAFFQPLMLAVSVVIFATNAAIWGIFFTFRGIYRYLYGQKKDGKWINYSKEDWEALAVPKRYLLCFTVFLYYCSAVIVVYLHLV